MRLICILNESRHDSYPQFPWSPLGTPRTMADHLGKTDEKKKKKKRLHFYSRSVKQTRLITKTKHQGFEISKKIVFSYPNCHARNISDR